MTPTATRRNSEITPRVTFYLDRQPIGSRILDCDHFEVGRRDIDCRPDFHLTSFDPDNKTSRRHVEFIRREDQVFVRRISDKNPVHLNQQDLAAKVDYPLKHGDEIVLSQFVGILFELTEENKRGWERHDLGHGVIRFQRNEEQLLAPTEVGGRYVVDDVLSAEGGFGVIYVARDKQLSDRKVLIKVRRYPAILFSYEEDESRIEQIRSLRGQTAFELKCLRHFRGEGENRIPSVHDFCFGYAPALVGPHVDQNTGREWFLDPRREEHVEIMAMEPYIVLQWVAGETLVDFQDRCAHERNWEVTVLKIGRELATILATFHERDKSLGNRYFIYQDLKPSNIIVSHGGFYTLVDFGALTLVIDDADGVPCSSNLNCGTPGTGTHGFKAPEMDPLRNRLRHLDDRVDIYALGANLFYLLTGLDPANEKEYGPLQTDRLQTRSPRSAELIRRAVAEDRDARFSNIQEMRREIMNSLRDVCRRA